MPERTSKLSVAVKFRDFVDAVGDEVPLYSRLAEAIVEDRELLDLAGRALPGQPPPNMLFAAVQYLLLGGLSDPLAAWYPAVSGSVTPGADPFPVFRKFCLTHRSELEELIGSRRTQTNEVARCLALVPALATVAGRIDRPMSLIEVGSSAGLLLAFDRYHYTYGADTWGPSGSPVRLTTVLRGQAPPLPAERVPIAGRLGIDLHPVDVTNPSDVRWLDALVWPGHEERRVRLRRAIEVVAPEPPVLLAGDALEVLSEAVTAVGDDTVPVVFHSFALIQWTPDQRAELDSLLREAERPVMRIWLEWFGYRRNAPYIRLFEYRDGSERVETFGRFHHHARWLDWGPHEWISGS